MAGEIPLQDAERVHVSFRNSAMDDASRLAEVDVTGGDARGMDRVEL